METTTMGRDWHKDPFLHSQLTEGKAKAPRDV